MLVDTYVIDESVSAWDEGTTGFKHGITTFQESHRNTDISKFLTTTAFPSAVLCGVWLISCKQTALPLKRVQNPSSGKVQ